MAVIEVINGPQEGEKYDLSGPRSVMGRHPDCHIVVDVGAVSRHHAQITSDGGNFFAEDLNSRNGTFVNDKMIRGRFQLNSGDVLRVCDIEFVFNNSEAKNQNGSTFDDVSQNSKLKVLFDDEKGKSSTIMSKLDISSGHEQAEFSTSPEAKLKTLIQIVQDLSKVLSLDEVLPKVLDSLFRIFMQADRGFIVLRSDDGRLVPMWSRFRRENQDEMIRISRTIVNHAIESKEAILSADAGSDKRFDLSQSVADFRIRSLMCAPLLDGEGNAFGALQVDTLNQKNRFETEDLEVLATVALQAGIAIDNAQMHENALRQTEIERDLKVAFDVQHGILPKGPPDLDEMQFFDYYRPANHIGGDYYDYIQLPDGRLAVIVADVVGHGIAAALLMAKFSAEARFALASQPTVSEASKAINEAMTRLDLERFVTMILTVIDPEKGSMTIANAGHMPPIVRRADGTIEEPGKSIAGLPFGIADGMDYGEEEVQLNVGDEVVLFTDGIFECCNSDGDQFGMERIRDLVSKSEQATANQIGNRIIDSVVKFVGSSAADDDMCLVCFGR